MKYTPLLALILTACSTVAPVVKLYNPNGFAMATGFNLKTRVGVRGITAGHFCGKAGTLFVLQENSDRLPIQFDDRGNDLCVVDPIDGAKTYEISSKPLEAGELLEYHGFPAPNRTLTTRTGRFLSYRVDMQAYPANSKGVCPTALVQGVDQKGTPTCLGLIGIGILEGQVYQGNSGGPVIRPSDGAVVGIMVQTELPEYKRGMFTPIETLVALIESGDVR